MSEMPKQKKTHVLLLLLQTVKEHWIPACLFLIC